MHDRVADVLAQRASLDRGASAAIAVSFFLHAGIGGVAVYSALHAKPPQHASTLNIQFASMPAAAVPAITKPAPKPVAPKIEESKPEPKPEPPKKAPEKNTVPLSPFGRSTKKGSEVPETAKPAPAVTDTAPAVPIGGSGVTALEGGDFPYTLYLQGMIRRIGDNWVRPTVAPGITVVIYFVIRRDGTISEARVEKPSGNPTFDRAALSAVRSSSPLTPLPFAYDGNFLGVHQTFK